MSRGLAARLVIAFAVALAGALVVLSAFGGSRSGGGWMFLAVMAAPLVLAAVGAGRAATAGFFLAVGACAVFGIFAASLAWDYQREREHPVIIFAIAVAPFTVVPMIPVVVAAWIRDLRLRHSTP